MKNSKKSGLMLKLFILVIITIPVSGFSQKKPKDSAQPYPSKLEYSFSSGQNIKYLSITNINQSLDVNGETMQVKVESVLGCEVKILNRQKENLNLEIVIDTLSQTVNMPQGSFGGPVMEARDKKFNMVLSTKGKETDLSGAEKVVFNLEGTGAINAKQYFLEFFPDLPDRNIKQGDTWMSNDTLEYKSTGMSVFMIVQANNKFEGVENINGIECVKISFTLTGARDTKSASQNGDVHSFGPFTGTGVLFFAAKEGYFVKLSTTSKLTGTIEIAGAETMSFPLVMDITSTNEIVK